jgi:hypothetical protein
VTTVSAAATSTTPQISSFRLLPVEIARARDEPPRRKGRRVAPVLHGYKSSYSNMSCCNVVSRKARGRSLRLFLVRVVTNYFNFGIYGTRVSVVRGRTTTTRRRTGVAARRAAPACGGAGTGVLRGWLSRGSAGPVRDRYRVRAPARVPHTHAFSPLTSSRLYSIACSTL